ncbi:hypothetical protein OAV71_02655 [Opitutales bacterium]|nr:hypothetical protein [Opitutales bacterium]
MIVQTGDGTPVSVAEVTFRDREYDWVMGETNAIAHMDKSGMQEWKDQHYASGPAESDGSFTFRAIFPAGGTRTMFWDTGRFRVGGTVSIRAEGYQSVETPLADLVGEQSISTRKHKKEPIIVRCSLEKDRSHNKRLNPTTEGGPSVEG